MLIKNLKKPLAAYYRITNVDAWRRGLLMQAKGLIGRDLLDPSEDLLRHGVIPFYKNREAENELPFTLHKYRTIWPWV